MHLKSEEALGTALWSGEVKEWESGGREESPNLSFDMANPQITRRGGSEYFRHQADGAAPSSLKSLILNEDTWLQFTFVIRSDLYAAWTIKYMRGEGEEGRLNAF